MSITYDEALTQIYQLTAVEQLRLLEELAALVRRQISAQPPRSVIELRGLGKGIWENVDAQDYVDQERASWNG